MLTFMKWCVMILATMLLVSQCGQPATAPADAREFLTWLEEARDANRFEDRLRTHERVLDAILTADAATLESVLGIWCRDDERYQRNDFVQMTWRRLAQIDTPRALKLLENVDDEYAFYLNAKEVWAEIARTDPERAYVAAQGFAPENKEQHERKWLVQHIMRAVGASWFRGAGLETLKRLPTLSHPALMATAVFKGCVDEAKTAEQKIALLDRFAGDAKPVIEENHIKSPNFCDELVRAAALADLAQTRAWVEQRFPAGQKRSDEDRYHHLNHSRQTLFQVWSGSDAIAAADWLIAQQHPDEDFDTSYPMTIALRAIAGVDRENLPAALGWLGKQTRPQDRVAALVDFLDDDFGEDAVLRQSRQTIALWLSQRPMTEREAVVLAAAKEYIRLQAKDDFLAIVYPDEAKRREMAAQLEQITGPPGDEDGRLFLRGVFDLPIRDKRASSDKAAAQRSSELAGLHELARTSPDPARRREGLAAIKWMQAATPAQIEPVLLACLANNDMTWFTEDLLSAWVLQDWRACEAFAMNAPLSVEKREDMIIHILCEAAELFPEAALAHLRELIETKVLVQAALCSVSSGSRVRWKTSYRSDAIIPSLARGLARRGDVKALATIQTLPPKWQPAALESLAGHFTTRECGKALLIYFEDQNQRAAPDEGVKGDVIRDLKLERWISVGSVLHRLANISPADAVRWLESNAARLRHEDEWIRAVRSVHAGWHALDPKAADAWLEKVEGHR
jgi:hypothetical protein